MNTFTSDNLLDEGEMEDFSSTPDMEVYAKVEVNHGLMVSTRQLPNTFYHKVVPSKTLQVQINPIVIPFSKSTLLLTSQDEENGSSKGRLCGDEVIKNIRSYVTFAVALCAAWLRIVA